MIALKSLLASLLFLAPVHAEIYFKETFDEGWDTRWVKSEWKAQEEIGEWKWAHGRYLSETSDKGIQTSQDARFYGISAKMDSTFNNEGKDIVVQFTVKHDQELDCGGAYIKLLPAGLDQLKFGGDSPYSIMFGPDVCGYKKHTHAIFGYNGPEDKHAAKNLEHKDSIRTETDHLTHLYTLIVKADNTYEVRIDNDVVKSGSLKESWDFIPSKKILDPAAKKPDDWVDQKKIPDPDDKKPDDWDSIPAKIPDPEAKQPDDWDEDEDGEWEPPMIDNPEFKGEWSPKLIDNPKYKGEWIHPEIDNPDYFEDDQLYYRCKDCDYVGFELWQVKSGTIFDDILITDSIEEAEAFAKSSWAVKKEKEKKALEEEKKREEEKRKEEENKKEEAEEDDDEDDDSETKEKDEL